MRALATVAQIASLIPIPWADKIQVATLVDRAWEVIVSKEYQVGDLGVYFEPDSFLPDLPIYEMLRARCAAKQNGKSGFRLKTMKMRGIFSQGLFMRLSDLGIQARELMTDLTAELGIELWQEGEMLTSFRPFPSFIPKTDQDRVENLGKKYAQLTGDYCWTEKLDGCSFTAFFNGEFGFCSRNYQLDPKEKNHYSDVVERYELEKLLRVYPGIAVQGEIIGPKIQGNRYKRSENQLYIYSIWDIQGKRYLPLDTLPLETVPILDHKPLPAIGDLRKAADGKSKLADTLREGFVLVSADLSTSFKVISREFLAL